MPAHTTWFVFFTNQKNWWITSRLAFLNNALSPIIFNYFFQNNFMTLWNWMLPQMNNLCVWDWFYLRFYNRCASQHVTLWMKLIREFVTQFCYIFYFNLRVVGWIKFIQYNLSSHFLSLWFKINIVINFIFINSSLYIRNEFGTLFLTFELSLRTFLSIAPKTVKRNAFDYFFCMKFQKCSFEHRMQD